MEIGSRTVVELPEGFRPVSQGIPDGYRPAAAQPEKEKAWGDYFRGLTQQVAKGVSMGFSDEITAALTAVPAALSTGTSVSDAFNSILDAERGGMEQFAEENPKTAIGAELAGGLLTGGVGASKIAGAKVFQGGRTIAARTGKKLAAQASAAAPIGAIYGAGSAEGGLTDRLEGAAEGAAIATVAAPVLGAAGGAVSKTVRGAFNAFRSGEEKALNKSLQQIARAVERDGGSSDEILAKAKVLGPEATAVDAGGVNLKRELERAASAPGAAPEMVEKQLIGRLSRSGVRIQQAFDKHIGRNTETATKTVEGLVQKARDEAAPHYEKAYASVVDNTEKRLAGLLENPRIQKAIPRAIDRIKSKSTDDDTLLAALQSDLNKEDPSMILWDHVKRQLDDDASAAYRRGENELGSDIAKNARLLRTALDDQSSDYKQARAIYAGSSRAREAFEDGMKFQEGLNNPLTGAAAKAEKFNELSQAEQDLFRKGVSMKVRQLIRTAMDTTDDTPPASLLKQIYGSKERRMILQKVIPTAEGRTELANALRAEHEFRKTTWGILKNSSTALRQELLKEPAAEMADKAQAGINLMFALKGSFFAMGRAIETVVKPRPPSEKVNAQVAKNLLAKGEEQIEKVLTGVNRYLVLPEATDSAIKRLMNTPKGKRMEFLLANPRVNEEVNHTVAALLAGMYASGKVKPDQEDK